MGENEVSSFFNSMGSRYLVQSFQHSVLLTFIIHENNPIFNLELRLNLTTLNFIAMSFPHLCLPQYVPLSLSLPLSSSLF